ncbi:MAG: ABC transporter ATP-binding protein, partial [Clostridia bacterium]
MVMPDKKAKDFKGTFRRLMGYFKPFTVTFIIVVVLAIVSCAFNVFAPKVMGEITTELSKPLLGGGTINMMHIIKIIFILLGMYILCSAFAYL